MGKAKRSRSPSPIVGYRRLRAKSFRAVTAKVPLATNRRQTRSAANKRLTIKNTDENESVFSDNSSCTYFEDEPYIPLTGIQSHIHDIESTSYSDEELLGRVTDYSFSDPTTRRELLSSTVDDIIDEFDQSAAENTSTVTIVVRNVLEAEPTVRAISPSAITVEGLGLLEAPSLNSAISLLPIVTETASLPAAPGHKELQAAENTSNLSDITTDNSRSISLPPTPNSTMPHEPAAAAIDAADLLVEADMIWHDDFLNTDMDQIPPSVLKELANTAVNYKDKLSSAILAVRRLPTNQLGELEDVSKLKVMKDLFVTFKNAAWPKVMAAETAISSRNTPVPEMRPDSRASQLSEATQSIVINRVQSRKETVIDIAKKIGDQLMNLVNQHPETNQKLIVLEGQLETAKLESKEQVEALKELAAAATSVGMAAEAQLLAEAADMLIELRTNAITSVRGARAALGIPDGPVTRSLILNMAAPKFKGDFKDNLDYFTFKKQLTEYFDSVGIASFSDKLLKLRNDCVVGAAKEAIVTAKSFNEAMTTLEDLYAKPEVLLAVKHQELLSLGQCPEGLLAKRTWYINVSNKYENVQALAEEHEIEDFLISSDLAHCITQAMLKADRDKFEQKIVKARRRARNVRTTKRFIGEMLNEFLEDIIEELGMTLDYRITNGYGNATEMMKGLQLDGRRQPPRVPPPGQASRTVHVIGESVTDDCVQITGGAEQPPLNSSNGSETADQEGLSRRQRKKFRQAGSTAEAAAAIAVNQTGGENRDSGSRPIQTTRTKIPTNVKCRLCDSEHESMVYCEKFRQARVEDRWVLLLKARACYRCLRSDAMFWYKRRKEWFVEHKPFCSDKFVCRHGQCAENESGKQNHLLVCKHHIQQNKDDHSAFMASVDLERLKNYRRFFFTAPSVMNVYETRELPPPEGNDNRQKTARMPIYMLQYIPAPDNSPLLLFYDSGCMEAAINDRAYSVLDTTCISKTPVMLNVAGGHTFQNPYGYEQIKLVKESGETAKINALRMVEITTEMPSWNLIEAWNEIQAACFDDKDGRPPPTCPSAIGGATVDIMLGVEYMSLFPDLIAELPGGLRIYRSRLTGMDGHQAVLAGSHDSWARATTAANMLGPRVYFTSEVRALRAVGNTLDFQLPQETAATAIPECFYDKWLQCVECGCWKNVLSEVGPHEHPDAVSCFQSISSELRKFDDFESIGSELSYRCVSCRNCNACRRSDELEEKSLQDEVEQSLIEGCVTLHAGNKIVVSKLPFIKDPESRLTPNRWVANKVLDTQVRIIDKTPGMKEAVIKAHNKLRDKGHVVPLTSLPPEVQETANQGGYFIPWRTVMNPGSISTPLRLVFDGSARTPGGDSLNETLARGENKLGRLLHLLIQFRYGDSAFSADVAMAYNTIRLDPQHYKYQKYLWKENLTPDEKVITMIVITLIYGIKPSGNLTICGFQRVAEYARTLGEMYRRGADALTMKAYMDDIFSSFKSNEERDMTAESLEKTLELGSMHVKAITRSGRPPPEDVTSDGKSVGVVGYKWFTEEDTLKLDIKPITLAKARRGKPATPVGDNLKEALMDGKFTKRVLAGSVAAIFDPLGTAAPVTGNLKVDMSEVCQVAKDWDEKLPATMIDKWVRNLIEIQNLAELTVPRNVSPGINGITLIVCADASQMLAAAAVYARTELEDGIYDCNLIIAKTKLVKKASIPRAELRAATLAASLAHVVKQNLGHCIRDEIYVTDSTITLFWLNQDQRPLQMSIRNSVIEVQRLSDVRCWFHIPGPQNPADIPTRYVTVKEIIGSSEWLKGKSWMYGPKEEMPLKSVSELNLTAEEKATAAEGLRAQGMIMSCKTAKVEDRYKFSRYIVNFSSKSWPKTIRLIALVKRCISIWRQRTAKVEAAESLQIVAGRTIVMLTREEIAAAERYVFQVTSREVKYFNKKESYEKISYMKDGVLLYSSRIMDGERPETIPGAMLDVGPLTFCVPIVDRHSPVAYSVMLYAHESLTHHGGVNSTLRRSREIVFIIRGMSLATEIKEACPFCKRYKQRMIQAEMGKIHPSRFTPAPPFHFTQVDLVGPWKARCEHSGHRAEVKVWGAVYKCATTLATWVEAMPAYDADSFVDTYRRFSARFGHIGIMFIDQGSQIMSACNKMEFSYADLVQGVNVKGVEVRVEVCPVGSHEQQGIVERAIREVRKIFNAVFKGLKLSILSYLTSFYYISSELNNIPICIGGKYTGLDNLDLISPARLLLGRNSVRAPIGIVTACVPSKWLETVEDVAAAWWKVWDEEWLATLVPKSQKWLEGKPDLEIGDIILFMRDGKEADLGDTIWRTGVIDTIKVSRDDIIRKITVKYKNPGEKVFRYTDRSVRTIVKLYREGDLDLLSELNQAAVGANKHYLTYGQVYSETNVSEGQIQFSCKCE